MEPFITEVNDWNRDIEMFFEGDERYISGQITNKKAPYLSYAFVVDVDEKMNIVEFIDYVNSFYETFHITEFVKEDMRFYDEICELIQDIIKQDRIRLLLGAEEV